MAQVLRVNGKIYADQFVGRELQYYTIGATAHNDASREIIVRTMREFGTIEVVGDLTTANTFRLCMSGLEGGLTALQLETAVQAAGAAEANAAATAATVVDFIF